MTDSVLAATGTLATDAATAAFTDCKLARRVNRGLSLQAWQHEVNMVSGTNSFFLEHWLFCSQWSQELYSAPNQELKTFPAVVVINKSYSRASYRYGINLWQSTGTNLVLATILFRTNFIYKLTNQDPFARRKSATRGLRKYPYGTS